MMNQTYSTLVPVPEGMGPAAFSKLGAPWWWGCLPHQTGGSLRWAISLWPLPQQIGDSLSPEDQTTSSGPHLGTVLGTKLACSIAGVRVYQRERTSFHAPQTVQAEGWS